MIPVKALQYEVILTVRRIHSEEDDWQSMVEFESAYTAADAITQVELRYKHNEQFEKAYVTDVRPRHR